MSSIKVVTPSEEYKALRIGARIRKLRQHCGYSLAQLAKVSSISEATLSRAENEQTALSTQHLYTLSCVLNVEITTFFTPDTTMMFKGARAVSPAREREFTDFKYFDAAVLCTELENKHMLPAVNIIKAKTEQQAGGLASHNGEEFLYVIQGEILLLTEAYKPLLLTLGDCIYFDASMAHCYVNHSETYSQILVVNSNL